MKWAVRIMPIRLRVGSLHVETLHATSLPEKRFDPTKNDSTNRTHQPTERVNPKKRINQRKRFNQTKSSIRRDVACNVSTTETIPINLFMVSILKFQP